MKHSTAVEMLSALANETRLQVFRLLVRQGPDGLSAGKISKRLKIPASTLSFHLNHLTKSELIESKRESRLIFYRAIYSNINSLTDYLMENCCKGDNEQ